MNEMTGTGHGWTAASLGGPEPLMVHLSDAERQAIMAKVDALGDHDPTSITRADFDAPEISALARRILDELDFGNGAVVIDRLDIAGLGEVGLARAFMGLATHLGEPVVQSAKGDRIGYVRKVADNPTARGYQSDVELRPHTDFHEILGLASVSLPAEGGLSGLVSLEAVYDILKRECPEILPALAEGFPHDTDGEGLMSDGPIPILSIVDGVVSGYNQGLFALMAAKTLGVELPSTYRDAMDRFTEVTMRPDVQLQFQLQPGQIVLWHNFRVLHSRTNFRDDETHRRLLLRIWVNPERHLPLPPVYLSQARRFDEMHARGESPIQYTRSGIKV